MRIVVLSDSCHSGTVTRGAPGRRTRGRRGAGDEDDVRPKQLPLHVAIATEKAHAALYAKLQKEIPSKRLTTVAATVVLISGCQDDQFSNDGRRNGVFTGALLKAWKEEPMARRSLKGLWEADEREDRRPLRADPELLDLCVRRRARAHHLSLGPAGLPVLRAPGDDERALRRNGGRRCRR